MSLRYTDRITNVLRNFGQTNVRHDLIDAEVPESNRN